MTTPRPPTSQGPQTPPKQVYHPGQFSFSPYPKGSPLKNVESSSGFGRFGDTSTPATPVKGLSNNETKSMSKIWNSPAKLVDVVISAITAYTGVQADTAQVTDIVKSLLELAVSGPLVLWV